MLAKALHTPAREDANGRNCMANICAFKILPKNETAAAVGHQAGFLITTSMRGIFPELDTRVTPANPTHGIGIEVTKIVDGYTIGTHRARYQFQTWGGTRDPEYRLTNGLTDLINAALPGDMLVIYPERGNSRRMAVEVVRQNSPAFEYLMAMAQGTRSGIATVPDEVIMHRYRRMQEAVAEMEDALHNMPFGRGHNQPPELVEENPLDELDRQALEQAIDQLGRIEARLEEKTPALEAAQETTSGILRKLASAMANSIGNGFDEFMKSFGKTLGPIAAVGVPVYVTTLHEKVNKVISTMETWLAALNLF